MDEDMYVVVRSRYDVYYKAATASYAGDIYSDLETFSEPMPLDEAEAIVKLMNAAEEELRLTFKASERYSFGWSDPKYGRIAKLRNAAEEEP
jgi:hypothetical protein